MKTTTLSALAIAVIFFAACSNNDDETPNLNDGLVKFSSGVTDRQTRVGGDNGNQWEGNEKIGIFMVENGSTTIAEGADNVAYVTTSTGTSATFTSTTSIYYPVDVMQKVDFIAYHPYSPLTNTYEYAINATVQENQSAIDLMHSAANNNGVGYDKTQAKDYVNLTFNHKLTKVIIQTEPGNGLTQDDLADMTITIKGLNTKAIYHLDTDVLETATDVAPIHIKTIEAGKKYEAIVIPQALTLGAATVEFALNNTKNEVFEYRLNVATFESAKLHKFNIIIQRTPILIKGTINAWTPVGVINGEAN